MHDHERLTVQGSKLEASVNNLIVTVAISYIYMILLLHVDILFCQVSQSVIIIVQCQNNNYYYCEN